VRPRGGVASPVQLKDRIMSVTNGSVHTLKNRKLGYKCSMYPFSDRTLVAIEFCFYFMILRPRKT